MKFLVAVDGSNEAGNALQYAADIAAVAGDQSRWSTPYIPPSTTRVEANRLRRSRTRNND